MPLCYEHLSQREREIIAINVRKRWSCHRIARELGRSPSTISRELRRNRFPNIYHAKAAHREALKRRSLPRRTRLLKCPKRRSRIERRLRGFWSPEQIVGRLNDVASKSTVYRMIHTDRLRWRAYLRGPVKPRRIYERIRRRKMIDQRPAIVDEKIRLGDWEADTVRGPMNSSACVMTLVDRRSKYLIARLLPDYSADSLNRAAIEALRSFEVQTITVDNGMEFAKFPVLEKELETEVYFAHERCPWERGLNENTNGLLRQFFPKGTDFSTVSPSQLRRAVALLNSRPRKTLGFQTPEEVMAAQGGALVT